MYPSTVIFTLLINFIYYIQIINTTRKYKSMFDHYIEEKCIPAKDNLNANFTKNQNYFHHKLQQNLKNNILINECKEQRVLYMMYTTERDIFKKYLNRRKNLTRLSKLYIKNKNIVDSDCICDSLYGTQGNSINTYQCINSYIGDFLCFYAIEAAKLCRFEECNQILSIFLFYTDVFIVLNRISTPFNDFLLKIAKESVDIEFLFNDDFICLLDRFKGFTLDLVFGIDFVFKFAFFEKFIKLLILLAEKHGNIRIDDIYTDNYLSWVENEKSNYVEYFNYIIKCGNNSVFSYIIKVYISLLEINHIYQTRYQVMIVNYILNNIKGLKFFEIIAKFTFTCIHKMSTNFVNKTDKFNIYDDRTMLLILRFTANVSVITDKLDHEFVKILSLRMVKSDESFICTQLIIRSLIIRRSTNALNECINNENNEFVFYCISEYLKVSKNIIEDISTIIAVIKTLPAIKMFFSSPILEILFNEATKNEFDTKIIISFVSTLCNLYKMIIDIGSNVNFDREKRCIKHNLKWAIHACGKINDHEDVRLARKILESRETHL